MHILHIRGWHNPIKTDIDYRSTPVETLHTILLGPYKYMFAELMGKLSTEKKREVAGKINSFPKSGLTICLSGGITTYHQSCVGRDFK